MKHLILTLVCLLLISLSAYAQTSYPPAAAGIFRPVVFSAGIGVGKPFTERDYYQSHHSQRASVTWGRGSGFITLECTRASFEGDKYDAHRKLSLTEFGILYGQRLWYGPGGWVSEATGFALVQETLDSKGLIPVWYDNESRRKRLSPAALVNASAGMFVSRSVAVGADIYVDLNFNEAFWGYAATLNVAL